MAGHSKSSNIKHRKNAQDARRSRLFTKLIREVEVAARQGQDPAINPRLRLARSKALAANINLDTLNKAINKTHDLNAAQLEEIRYEGYGPEGIAVLVEAMTDNRNRTAGEVRYVFSRHGGNLGTEGSVSWLFEQKGIIQLAENLSDENSLMELALEVGAEDIIFSKEQQFSNKLITDPESFTSITQSLAAHSISTEEAILGWLPTNRVLIEDSQVLMKINQLVEALEDLSDVQSVYTTCSWQLY